VRRRGLWALGFLVLLGVAWGGWKVFWRFDPAAALPRSRGAAAVLHLADGARTAELLPSISLPLPLGPFGGMGREALAPLTEVLGETALMLDGEVLRCAFLPRSDRGEELKSLLEGRTFLRSVPLSPQPKGGPTWRLELPSGESLWIQEFSRFPVHLFFLASRPEALEDMGRARKGEGRLELDRRTQGADYLWFCGEPQDSGEEVRTELAWGGDEKGFHVSFATDQVRTLLGELPEAEKPRRIAFPGRGELVGMLGVDGGLLARMAATAPGAMDAWFRALWPGGDPEVFRRALETGRLTLAWVLPPGASAPREYLCLQPGDRKERDALRARWGSAGSEVSLEGFEGARVLSGARPLTLAWRDEEFWFVQGAPSELEGKATVPEALKDLPAPVNLLDLILDARGLRLARERFPLPPVLASAVPSSPKEVAALRFRLLGPVRGDFSLFFKGK